LSENSKIDRKFWGPLLPFGGGGHSGLSAPAWQPVELQTYRNCLLLRPTYRLACAASVRL